MQALLTLWSSASHPFTGSLNACIRHWPTVFPYAFSLVVPLRFYAHHYGPVLLRVQWGQWERLLCNHCSWAALGPWTEARGIWFLPHVWNCHWSQAVIWFPFRICSLIFSAWCFCSLRLVIFVLTVHFPIFFKKSLKHFSLRERPFCMVLVRAARRW